MLDHFSVVMAFVEHDGELAVVGKALVCRAGAEAGIAAQLLREHAGATVLFAPAKPVDPVNIIDIDEHMAAEHGW